MEKKVLDSKGKELISLINSYYEMKLRYNELSSMRNSFKSFGSHAEDCDDEYQEQLELSWEIRDVRDAIVECESNCIKFINWFKSNGYSNAIKVFLSRYSDQGVKFLNDHKL